jgi:hypothetical protein
MANYSVICASCGRAYDSSRHRACPRCAAKLIKTGDLFGTEDKSASPPPATGQFAGAFLCGSRKVKPKG